MENLRIHHCYCEIPEEVLKRIAFLRYVEGVPTEDLMARAGSQKEREFIATVALLDVDPEKLPSLVETERPDLLTHLHDCRAHILSFLELYGIRVKGNEPDQAKK